MLACPEGANLLAPPTQISLTRPEPSELTDHWWVDASIFASATFAMTDLSSTSYAAGKWGEHFKEANWVLRPFARDPVALGVAKAAIDGSVTFWMVKVHKKSKKHRAVVVAVALGKTALSAYVTHRNAKQLGLRD